MCPPGYHHMYYVHLAFVRFEHSNDFQTYTQDTKYIILTQIQSGMVKTKKLKIITRSN